MALREALKRTESERAKLEKRAYTLSRSHERAIRAAQEQHDRDLNDIMSSYEKVVERENHLNIQCEEYRARMKLLSKSVSDLKSRLARSEEFTRTQQRKHEEFVEDLSEVHRKLLSENSRLHSELLDFNS